MIHLENNKIVFKRGQDDRPVKEDMLGYKLPDSQADRDARWRINKRIKDYAVPKHIVDACVILSGVLRLHGKKPYTKVRRDVLTQAITHILGPYMQNSSSILADFPVPDFRQYERKAHGVQMAHGGSTAEACLRATNQLTLNDLRR